MGLWTQRLGLSWRSSVRFFEHRYRVLERLEDDALLWGFMVDENEVAVRLGDPNHLLFFGPTNVSAALLQPDGDEDRLKNAVEMVIDALEPRSLVRPTFGFQWLVGVEGSYDEVRGSAAQTFLPSAPGHATDLSAWIDGELDSGKEYSLECGIVEAIEAPPRLARDTGRFFTHDPRIQASLWPIENLPPVAFFCDIEFEPGDEVGSAGDFFNRWGETREDAKGVVSVLMARFNLPPT